MLTNRGGIIPVWGESLEVFGRKLMDEEFVEKRKEYELRWSLERVHLGFVIRGWIKGKPGRVEIARFDVPKRVVAGGWQSWSPFRLVETDGYTFNPGSWRFRNSPVPEKNNLSDYILITRDMTAGFLSSRYGHPFFSIEGSEVVAYIEYFDSKFEDFVPLEPLAVLNAPEHLSPRLYADLLARENNVKRNHLDPLVWCSWYRYYDALEWKDVLKNLEMAPSFGFEVFQIDDGYETNIGDFLDVKEGFPDLYEIARKVRERGMKAGIWVAPFIASESSKLFRKQPDWFVKEGEKPVPVLRNWGRDIYALDLTRRDVLDHVEGLFRKLRSIGFEYFKVDFLFAGAVPGERQRGGPIEAYRMGMEAIRRGAGSAFVLGCGAPLLPSIGLVDGMRVGEDTSESWEGDEISMKNALRNAITRYFFSRVWRNDPDCLILRKSVPENQRRVFALTAGALDGLICVSDDLDEVDDLGREILRKALSLKGGKVVVRGILDEEYEIEVKGAKIGNAILKVNLDEPSMEIELSERLSLEREIEVKDGRIFAFYWRD